MNDTDLINWLNFHVQNDDYVLLEEGDGGVLATVYSSQLPVAFGMGPTVREALIVAAEQSPAPNPEP